MAYQIARSCLAYLDPGTGSLAIQVVIAALAGGIFTVRRQIAQGFTRLKNLFKKKKPE